LDKHYLEGISAEGGRFRSYLLTMVKHFLAKERHKDHAHKRGGYNSIISFDAQAAEDRYQFEPVDQATPETDFERRWASTVLDQVMAALEADYTAQDKSALFLALRPCFSGDRNQIPYAELGTRLAMSEDGIKVAVHRLRKRYGELLRTHIAHTVNRVEDIDDEIRHLISVVG
jgi:RNA polymerase sigma-70 factor (ECF subfamily)